MKTSYESRIKQRQIYLAFGNFMLTKLALSLIALGFVLLFFPVETKYSLALAGFAAVTGPFGTIFVIFLGKIGWSNNPLVDICFNQGSVIIIMIGYLVSLLYVGFFILVGINYPYLLIASFASLLSGVILMALGRQLSSMPK